MHSYKSKKTPENIDVEISSELLPDLKDYTRSSDRHTDSLSRSDNCQIGTIPKKTKKRQKNEKK
ncbi:MAG: hypothetical protein GX824_02810 [Clostridiales bacterium]|nr:hypothetical protein [Clostridiales bacterium]